ncbi:hypothetical protein [Allomuricauda sp. M10]|uniref:hypothetical protein n=1 Tax=Allomuricauda sp. M10 TaxID=2683292 RepID=UPI001D193229|nr:hypothetical protein [Muricauda sp. M10]
MKSRITYFLLLVLGFTYAGQAQLNDYKYIIVPKKFAAFKGENRYQTSTLVKYYFTKNGFNAIYDDEMPLDLATNRCLGLVADLLDNSSMFSTNIIITLKNCENSEVYRTFEGKSKTKDYVDAYKEAIQDAFVSFAGMDYKYQPKQTETPKNPVVISFKDDVKTVVEKEKEYVVEQKATTEEQVYKSVEPKPSNISKAVAVEASETITTDLLYAQPIANGYQLVDSTPKVVLKLESTSMDNVFLTQVEGNNAVVFSKDGKWILEYLENGNKQQKELNIKF